MTTRDLDEVRRQIEAECASDLAVAEHDLLVGLSPEERAAATQPLEPAKRKKKGRGAAEDAAEDAVAGDVDDLFDGSDD